MSFSFRFAEKRDTTALKRLWKTCFGDEDEYINQVMSFFESKTEIESYAKQARVQAEHCSSRNYAERVLEVYDRAIKEKNKEEKYGIISKILNIFKGE